VIKANITEAKRNLSRLIERTAAGEDVIISKAGEPVAKLIAYSETKKRRRLGGWKGQIWIAPNFDEELLLVPASALRTKPE
jgi:prevent-host-death family protein